MNGKRVEDDKFIKRWIACSSIRRHWQAWADKGKACAITSKNGQACASIDKHWQACADRGKLEQAYAGKSKHGQTIGTPCEYLS